MYFSQQRGVKPTNTNPSGPFSFGESSDWTDDEQYAVQEAYDDNSTPLNFSDKSYVGQGVLDEEAVIEAAIVQEAMMMHDDERTAWMNSPEFQQLHEAGVVGRKAIVRMSKEADLDRRMHLLCLQMGKENGDADWEALRLNRIKERKLLDKLYKKYGNRVKRQAVMSQKRLVKLDPKKFNLNTPIR